MADFKPISVDHENVNNPATPNPHDGLLWAGMVSDRYLAELQLGILPQLVHLVIFDTEDDHKMVYEALRAFEVGDTMGPEQMAELQGAVQEALTSLESTE